MKRIITLMALLICLTSSAQRLTVHGQPSDYSQNAMPDSVFNKHLFDAGKYLDKAADFEAVAWGCGIASIMSFTMFKDSDTSNILGVGFAVSAIASKICSITYKKKSGTELKVAAGYVSLTF